MLLLNLEQGGKSKNLIKWILPANYRQGNGLDLSVTLTLGEFSQGNS